MQYQPGASRIAVLHDHVGQLAWAHCFEVDPLARDVATPVALESRLGRSEERQVACAGTPHRLLEIDVDEYPEIPAVVQIRPQEEDAVEEQDGVDWRRVDHRVRPEVEGGTPVEPVAARAEGHEEKSPERIVIEGVEVVALGRVYAASVALGARPVKAIDRRSDHRSSIRAQDRRELVGERRLAGGVDAVDGDADRVKPLNVDDEPREAV